MALAAHAIWGSRATGRRGGFKYRTVRVRIPPPLHGVADIRCPFVQPAGRRSLKAPIVVRIHGGQRCRRARLRPRVRTTGGPGRHRVAALMCSYSNHGREASPRCWMLRVRIPPSARGRRLPMGGELLIPAHACLVATVSTPPRYGGSRGSIPRAGSHVVVAQLGQSTSSPSKMSPVQIWSATRMPF